MKSFRNMAVSIAIAFTVDALWKSLELIFYSEIQPRIVDDSIYIILVFSLHLNYTLTDIILNEWRADNG